MTLAPFFEPIIAVAPPPPGSVNVRVGKSVEGPGGRWVPVATAVSNGVFLSGLFQVGPGQRQVCVADHPLGCPEDALSRAQQLAQAAAA